MGILLTDEEIKEASREYPDSMLNYNPPQLRRITISQLKKAGRWGSEYCELQNRPRRECGHCWQALLKEVE